MFDRRIVVHDLEFFLEDFDFRQHFLQGPAIAHQEAGQRLAGGHRLGELLAGNRRPAANLDLDQAQVQAAHQVSVPWPRNDSKISELSACSTPGRLVRWSSTKSRNASADSAATSTT